MKLKIGEKLYRYVPHTGIMSYEVIEVRTSKNANNYVIECQMCKDHENCQILIEEITKGKYKGNFKYVEMINNNDDYNDQSFYHTTYEVENGSGSYYTRDVKDAQITAYENAIETQKRNISYHENTIKECQEKIDEYNEALRNLKG